MTGSHVKIGFLALCLALLIGIPAAWLAGDEPTRHASTDIAIEHDAPATIRIARMTSSGTNVIELSFAGTGSVAMHLPASWTRQEVRGVDIALVTAVPQDWDFVRWSLPAGATVRFDAPNPGRITLHNPSGIPVTVSTTTVDVRSGTREDDARIVTHDSYPLP